MCRIEIDLQDDEIHIGTVRSMVFLSNSTQLETEAAGASHLRGLSSAENSIGSKDRGLFLSRGLYRFEWFRVLIGMVLLVVSEFIVYVLVFVRLIPNVVLLWYPFLVSMAFGLFLLLLYTSIFVVLMEHHEAIEKILDKHAHLWPGLRHTCLRRFAYFYACGVIVVIAFVQKKFNYI